MILLVVGFLAISGLLATTGLMYFHVVLLFSKENRLHRILFHSLIFAVSFLLLVGYIIGQIDYDYHFELEKYYIFFTIVIKQILIIFAILKFVLKRSYYFNTEFRKYNTGTLIFYIISIIFYLFFPMQKELKWDGKL